jgi:hypothetical protein
MVLYSEQERQETLIRIYTTLLATNARSVVGNPRNDCTRLVDSALNRRATPQRGGEWAGYLLSAVVCVCNVHRNRRDVPYLKINTWI